MLCPLFICGFRLPSRSPERLCQTAAACMHPEGGLQAPAPLHSVVCAIARAPSCGAALSTASELRRGCKPCTSRRNARPGRREFETRSVPLWAEVPGAGTTSQPWLLPTFRTVRAIAGQFSFQRLVNCGGDLTPTTLTISGSRFPP